MTLFLLLLACVKPELRLEQLHQTESWGEACELAAKLEDKDRLPSSFFEPYLASERTFVVQAVGPEAFGEEGGYGNEWRVLNASSTITGGPPGTDGPSFTFMTPETQGPVYWSPCGKCDREWAAKRTGHFIEPKPPGLLRQLADIVGVVAIPIEMSVDIASVPGRVVSGTGLQEMEPATGTTLKKIAELSPRDQGSVPEDYPQIRILEFCGYGEPCTDRSVRMAKPVEPQPTSLDVSWTWTHDGCKVWLKWSQPTDAAMGYEPLEATFDKEPVRRGVFAR